MRSLWQLDAHLRGALQRDPRLAYALAYGSLTQGTADEFSDAEYYCWGEQPVNAEAWLREALNGTPWQILHAFVNDFGTPNFVLSGLLRVELHSKRLGDLEQTLGWANENLFPERMLVKDADGRLTRLLEQMTAQLSPTADVDAQVILTDSLAGSALVSTCWREGNGYALWSCWDGLKALCCGWRGFGKRQRSIG